MALKLSFFMKINLLIVFLIVPVILLNAYSTNVGNSVVKKQIEVTSISHMSLLNKEIDTYVNQLSTYAITLIRDNSVREFIIPSYFDNPYQKVKLYLDLEEKLQLNAASTAWRHHVTVFAPKAKAALSVSGAVMYDESEIKRKISTSWTYMNETDGNGYFIRHFFENYSVIPDVKFNNVIIEVTFPLDDLVHMLDKYKTEGSGDPLFYSPGEKLIISNSTSDRSLSNQIVHQLNSHIFQESGSRIIDLGHKKYFVSYNHSKSLDWYLLDYVPVADVTAPITRSLHIFYVSVGVLVILAFIASFLVYRNIQLPIRNLIASVRAIIRGDYSVRLVRRSNIEFQFLFDLFNHMANQIQNLISKVYESQLRLNESKLKLLQSQIDPHFLYNCLFYIKNNARIGNDEMVVAMALNLGEYYRYSTKLDKPLTSLREELNLVENYLNIHNLRLNRIRYESEFPEEMMKLQIPRLLLQPIVENAVIHGIEQRYEPGIIKIMGTITPDAYMIVIENSGTRIENNKLAELQNNIQLPVNESESCGLWNVRQRLLLHFGKTAELICQHSDFGGLKVTMVWHNNQEEQ